MSLGQGRKGEGRGPAGFLRFQQQVSNQCPLPCSYVAEGYKSRESVNRGREGTWLLCLAYLQKSLTLKLHQGCKRASRGRAQPRLPFLHPAGGQHWGRM